MRERTGENERERVKKIEKKKIVVKTKSKWTLRGDDANEEGRKE